MPNTATLSTPTMESARKRLLSVDSVRVVSTAPFARSPPPGLHDGLGEDEPVAQVRAFLARAETASSDVDGHFSDAQPGFRRDDEGFGRLKLLLVQVQACELLQ